MPPRLQPELSPLSKRPAGDPGCSKMFVRLVRHFAAAILQSGDESGHSASPFGVGWLLALLATPGGFLALFLFNKYSPTLRLLSGGPLRIDVYAVSLPDKYLFIAYSMAVTGVVVAWKWERILPGRKDYFVFAPLPIRLPTIFMANFTAIFLLAFLFIVDVNAVSSVLYPVVVMEETPGVLKTLRFIGVHATCMIAASGFAFLACYGILVLLMAILPYRAFRSISRFMRTTIVAASIALLCSSFAVARTISDTAAASESAARFLPSVWYVALYQCMQGKSNPKFDSLAAVGLEAIAILLITVLVLAVLNYRRYFVRIPEATRLMYSRRHAKLGWLTGVIDQTMLRDGFQRACYRFGLRVLLRSETHFTVVAAFTGMGLVLASQMLLSLSTTPTAQNVRLPPMDVLAAPLAVAYCLILGLRFVIEIPARLDASWIYKLVLHKQRQGAGGVAKKLMLTFLIPFVIVPCIVAYGWNWGIELGSLHASFVLFVSLLFIDILLLRFRKIPFACASGTFQNNTIMIVLIFCIGFVLFTKLAARIECRMLGWPVSFAALPVILAMLWLVQRKVKRETPDFEKELVFENIEERAVQTLDI